MSAKLPPVPKQKTKILSSKKIYQGRSFGLRQDKIIEPTGIHTTRDVITHHGSVVVLPVLPDGRIVLIRQYRHATRQFLWELVAGHLEKGESIKTGAYRELIEETGYRARKFTPLVEFWPTPGFLEEKMHVLLATGLTLGEAEPEDDEKIVLQTFTKREVEQMIQAGKLQDGKSIAGLLYYFRFVSKA